MIIIIAIFIGMLLADRIGYNRGYNQSFEDVERYLRKTEKWYKLHYQKKD